MYTFFKSKRKEIKLSNSSIVATLQTKKIIDHLLGDVEYDILHSNIRFNDNFGAGILEVCSETVLVCNKRRLQVEFRFSIESDSYGTWRPQLGTDTAYQYTEDESHAILIDAKGKFWTNNYLDERGIVQFRKMFNL